MNVRASNEYSFVVTAIVNPVRVVPRALLMTGDLRSEIKVLSSEVCLPTYDINSYNCLRRAVDD